MSYSLCSFSLHGVQDLSEKDFGKNIRLALGALRKSGLETILEEEDFSGTLDESSVITLVSQVGNTPFPSGNTLFNFFLFFFSLQIYHIFKNQNQAAASTEEDSDEEYSDEKLDLLDEKLDSLVSKNPRLVRKKKQRKKALFLSFFLSLLFCKKQISTTRIIFRKI
jgi:hypothetical protein